MVTVPHGSGTPVLTISPPISHHSIVKAELVDVESIDAPELIGRCRYCRRLYRAPQRNRRFCSASCRSMDSRSRRAPIAVPERFGPNGMKLSPEHYQNVATVYLAARREGRSTQRAVMAQFDVSWSRASVFIRTAKQMGEL